MPAELIGVAVNPASGKDVRRLVARASVFDNQEKCAIVRRAIVGALGAGADRFAYVPDSHDIAEAAMTEFGSSVQEHAARARRFDGVRLHAGSKLRHRRLGDVVTVRHVGKTIGASS